MTTVNVNLKSNTDKSYKIFIQKGLTNEIPKKLASLKLGNKYAIITDSKVKKLYADAFCRYLKKNNIEAEVFSFPFGERSKNLNTIEQLTEKMLNKNFTRKDAIIALGGGVTGDIAGFLASIYMRGIPYIQIPSTLLAMVDSSVGGKTGVNLKSGKNLIGTFNQPAAVFIDISYLKTLAEKQIKNGLAEIIKYGVIKDKKLFNFIEQNLEKIIRLEETAIRKVIKRSIEIKAKIVEEDEKEKGKRMILNYGHTYGHAIEKSSNYKLLHGFAISIGMVIANKIAIEKVGLKKEEAERIKNLIKKAGLPIVTIQKPSKKDILNDKKNFGNYINLILPTKIGEVKIYKELCQ